VVVPSFASSVLSLSPSSLGTRPLSSCSSLGLSAVPRLPPTRRPLGFRVSFSCRCNNKVKKKTPHSQGVSCSPRASLASCSYDDCGRDGEGHAQLSKMMQHSFSSSSWKAINVLFCTAAMFYSLSVHERRTTVSDVLDPKVFLKKKRAKRKKRKKRKWC
jgi:hypothetical protein